MNSRLLIQQTGVLVLLNRNFPLHKGALVDTLLKPSPSRGRWPALINQIRNDVSDLKRKNGEMDVKLPCLQGSGTECARSDARMRWRASLDAVQKKSTGQMVGGFFILSDHSSAAGSCGFCRYNTWSCRSAADIPATAPAP